MEKLPNKQSGRFGWPLMPILQWPLTVTVPGLLRRITSRVNDIARRLIAPSHVLLISPLPGRTHRQ